MAKDPMTEIEFNNRETRTFLRSLPWGDLSGELVMDVGCGFGNMSTQCILERFPRVRGVIAIDKSSECIQRSKVEFRNGIFRKAQFKKANVTVMRHLRRWKGKISKIISAHCLSDIEKKERAFQIMHELLKPGGQAALLFTGRSQSDDVYTAMIQNPKWSPYFTVINEDQVFKCAPDYYYDLLAEVGFKVHFCDQQIVEYTFYEDEDYRTFLEDVWGDRDSFIASIPTELHDEFMEDTFSTFLSLHPRNKNGNMGYRYYTVKALVEKDVDWQET